MDLNQEQVVLDTDMSTAAKASALRAVARKTFTLPALAIIAELPPGRYLAEDIRFAIVERGIRPHIDKAWGALIRTALNKGLIHFRGEWAKARSVRSHAHMSMVYWIET
jgi:hypothetical protein